VHLPSASAACIWLPHKFTKLQQQQTHFLLNIMKGTYTLQKPATRPDLVVLDVNISRPGCTDKWGWEMWISKDYSAYIRNHIPQQEFFEFVEEANKAMETSKLKVGGVLGNSLVLLTCGIPLSFVKVYGDKALSKAVDALDEVVRKWNDKFMADGRMISMRTKHLRGSLSPLNELNTGGSLQGTANNFTRLTDLDDEVWIEVQIITTA
jgi:hypothetical protein